MAVLRFHLTDTLAMQNQFAIDVWRHSKISPPAFMWRHVWSFFRRKYLELTDNGTDASDFRQNVLKKLYDEGRKLEWKVPEGRPSPASASALWCPLRQTTCTQLHLFPSLSAVERLSTSGACVRSQWRVSDVIIGLWKIVAARELCLTPTAGSFGFCVGIFVFHNSVRHEERRAFQDCLLHWSASRTYWSLYSNIFQANVQERKAQVRWRQ